jgi:hypothetical protein
MATDKGIGSTNQAKSDASGPNGERTKKILIAGRTFWKSESERNTPEGVLQTVILATELNEFVLQFHVSSFDRNLTVEFEQSIEALKFFDPAIAPTMGRGDHVYDPSVPQLNDRISQLSDGVISGGMYYNSELGFRYQFPQGWTVYDRANSEEIIDAAHPAVWRGPFIGVDHAAAHGCTKTLLSATRYAAGMKVDRFNPAVLLVAADPNCATGITFPDSIKDHDAIQRITNRALSYFHPSGTASAGPARVRAFDNAGRVMLEISRSISFSTNETGNSTFYSNIHFSMLLMQAKQYWVMWMFVTDDDAELSRLRATKIFFNQTPMPPTSESK